MSIPSNASPHSIPPYRDIAEHIIHHHLATDRYSIAILLNVAIAIFFSFFLLIKTLFLGTLTVIESSQLADRILRFTLLKVVFLGAVVSPTRLDISLYLLWAVFIGAMKALVGLAHDRSDALLSSPTSTLSQHVRCALLLTLVLVADVLWMVSGIKLISIFSSSSSSSSSVYRMNASVSWMLVWMFDAACVGVEGVHAGLRYAIGIAQTLGGDVPFLFSLRAFSFSSLFCSAATGVTKEEEDGEAEEAATGMEGRESSREILYMLDLTADVLLHFLNLTHYMFILHLRGGIKMQLIDVALLTDLRFLLNTAWHRAQGHLKYCHLTDKLRHSFPDASGGDVKGGVCAICMDPMTNAKVVRCGHMFHFGCLRSWLGVAVAGRFTCPLCRADLTPVDGGEGGCGHRVHHIEGHHHREHHREQQQQQQYTEWGEEVEWDGREAVVVGLRQGTRQGEDESESEDESGGAGRGSLCSTMGMMVVRRCQRHRNQPLASTTQQQQWHFWNAMAPPPPPPPATATATTRDDHRPVTRSMSTPLTSHAIACE